MMNKKIISINGINKIGKTTLLNKLNTKNRDYKILTVKDTYKLKNYNWWFKECTAYELIDELFNSLLERNEHIKKSNSRFFILDKGIVTIEARIYATLKIKELQNNDINKAITYYKKLCNKLYTEDISLRIKPKAIPHYNSYLFQKYNLIQNAYLDKANFDYVINTKCYCTDENIKTIMELIER